MGIKELIERLQFIANNTHQVAAEEIEEVCDAAADALAPLAEPVEMPGAYEISEAIESAEASGRTRDAAVMRGFRAVLERAAARADDTQRMLEAEHDAHMECHRRAEAIEGLLAECRELIGSGHNDFTHDYQRDANKCPTCKLIKRTDSALDAAGKEHHD